MSQPHTQVVYQTNMVPAMIAALASLVVTIPLTIFLTIWLLSPSVAQAGEFNQTANTGTAAHYPAGYTGSCVDPSLSAANGGSGVATPVVAESGDVNQEQNETNTTTTTTTTTIFRTNVDVRDSFNPDNSRRLFMGSFNNRSFNDDSFNEDNDSLNVEIASNNDIRNSGNEDTMINSSDDDQINRNNIEVDDSIGVILGTANANL